MPTLPVPDDFREVAPLLTMKELIQRYRHDGDVIRRWEDETGAYAKNARGRYTDKSMEKEISTCLHCPYSKCISHCPLIKNLKTD